jgi:serine/threonine protein kinase
MDYNIKNLYGGALLDEGGYGCIFYPALNNKGEDMKTDKLVSKLQRFDQSAINELEISEMVYNIEGYKNHYAPIIKYSNVSISKIKTDNLKNCSLISNEKINKLINMKMNYVNGIAFINYLIENKENNKFINNMIQSYIHLLKGFNILIQKNIVHFDVKGDNILFDEDKELPIIIDFGLSIDFNIILNNPITMKMLKKYFYVFAPDYYIWPLEVHYLCYLLKINMFPTDNDLKQIAKVVTKYNIAIIQNFSPTFEKNYEEMCYKQLLIYKNKSNNINTVIKEILKHYKTWDNYGLSMLFLNFFKYFKTEKGYAENTFIIFFTELLLKNIHPNPDKRVNIIKTWQIFTEFIYNQNIKNILSFTDITRLYIDNRDTIIKKLMIQKKTIRNVTKKLIDNR